jgi:multicomponent Na+:H+ antiporter subunit E
MPGTIDCECESLQRLRFLTEFCRTCLVRIESPVVKHAIALFVALIANWLLWSGHFDNVFLLVMGLGSCLLCLWIASRMRIIDGETIPTELCMPSSLGYAAWLTKEIILSNIKVAKIILARDMPMRRFMVMVPARQKTELGQVIFANSITLTPGTVSVQMDDDQILVHGLSMGEVADDMSDNMGVRVCRLETGKHVERGKPAVSDQSDAQVPRQTGGSK